MGQSFVERAVRTGKLPKHPNLIIPRLIGEGLSCLSPSSGQHWLSLTQMYHNQTTMASTTGQYNEEDKLENTCYNHGKQSQGTEKTQRSDMSLLSWEDAQSLPIQL